MLRPLSESCVENLTQHHAFPVPTCKWASYLETSTISFLETCCSAFSISLDESPDRHPVWKYTEIFQVRKAQNDQQPGDSKGKPTQPTKSATERYSAGDSIKPQPQNKAQHFRKEGKHEYDHQKSTVYVHDHDPGTNQGVLCMCRYMYITL